MYWGKMLQNLEIDVKDNYNCSPLHFACLNKQNKNVEILLSMNAAPNQKDARGKTPIHIALMRYKEDKEYYCEKKESVAGSSLDAIKDEESEEFDKIKRVIKELLFNGANRDEKV